MSISKRKNRRQSLNDSETKFVSQHLGSSEKTRGFVQDINSILQKFSDEDFFFNELDTPVYVHLRRISKIAKELAEFLEQTHLNEVRPTPKADAPRSALLQLFSLPKPYKYNFDDRELKDYYQEKLSYDLRHIHLAITEFTPGNLLDMHKPLQKPKDYEIDSFTEEVIDAFENNMGKLPVISETSTDFQVILIIYEVFDYDHSDALIKKIKKRCKKIRELRKIFPKSWEDPDL
jgi:hypothetical protein